MDIDCKDFNLNIYKKEIKEMFCFHKFGKLENNIQYCSKCGKARRVKCQHNYTLVEKYSITNYLGNNNRIIHVLKCVDCGKMINHTVSV